MLAGSHRNAWPDETGTGGRTNRNTHGFRHLMFERQRHMAFNRSRMGWKSTWENFG